MSHKADVTAIVLTLNEEQNLPACLDSIVGVCKTIYVVDSGSTDDTTKIAKDYGAHVVTHDFVTHAMQFNWALNELPIETKWVLRIDADERLSNELQQEMHSTLSQPLPEDLNGFVLRFKTIFMGRFLRHGGVYPFRKLLLFKFHHAVMQDRAMDEHIELTSGYAQEMKHDGYHYDYKSLESFIKKHAWYAAKEVYEYEKSKATNTLTRKRKVYYALPMFFRAKWYFYYRYIIRLGFLDGREGRIFHTLQAHWYRFLVDSLIHERSQNPSDDIHLGHLK